MAGSTSTKSDVRESISSIAPPAYPEMPPMSAPIRMAASVAIAASASVARAPYSSRARMSRPNASAPRSSSGPPPSSTDTSRPPVNHRSGTGRVRSSSNRRSRRLTSRDA